MRGAGSATRIRRVGTGMPWRHGPPVARGRPGSRPVWAAWSPTRMPRGCGPRHRGRGGVDFSASTGSIGGPLQLLNPRVGGRVGARVGRRARGRIHPAHAPPCESLPSAIVPRVRLAVGCVILFACAASCAPGQAESPEVNGRRYFGSLAAPAGQTLRFNLGSEPELRDPGTMSGQPDGRFARLVFEGLTTSDPRTLEPRPGQAYRWNVSADGLTYTFHLRPGLQWADGRALTARDFQWSWLRVLAPATAARNASLFYSIRGAEDYNKGTDA